MLDGGPKIMSQLAPVMLTAEQFAQLPTKDYIDEKFATKDDLKNFATKDYIDERFKNIDERFKNIERKFEERFKDLSLKLEYRFNILDYKIDTNVAQSTKDLNVAILNHEIRIKKLESKYI